MKNIKRVLAVLLVMCMAVGLMAGCGDTAAPSGSTGGTSGGSDNSAPASDGPINMKLFHKFPEIGKGLDYFEGLADDFMSKNPNVKITIEAVSDEEAKSKLRVMMGADSQPDVYFSWCGEFCYKFARAGQAWDMTDYFNADTEWKDSFMAAALDPCTLDGKLYGIPFRLIGKTFVYNKAMFDERNMKAPTTWEELMTICQTFKDEGIEPIAFGNLQPWPACHYITGFNAGCVPSEVRQKDYNYATGEFTDPGYVTALGYLKELGDKGYFSNGFNSVIHDVASENFKIGKNPLFYCETGEYGGLMDQGLEIGVFPMPELDEKGDKNYIVGGPDCFMISSKSNCPETGMEFLKLLTSKEWMEKMITDLDYPVPVKGVLNENNANYALVEAMKYVEEADALINWLDTDVHTKVSDAYLPAMQEMLNGTLTPEQVMEKVQEAAQIVKTEEA
ncbi:MAG: extracellular solute-binding protein [Oscillospiraceae bacterium]|nr:extracellular solute-binding protein [Oscillospiraceae bacterium]